MKKYFFIVSIVMHNLVYAQSTCTPNISCIPAATTFGVCPDSVSAIPLLTTTVGAPFSAQVSIKIPSTVVSGGITVSVSQFCVTNIDVNVAGTYVSLSTVGLSYLGNGTNTPSSGIGIAGFTSTNFCYFPAPAAAGKCIELSGSLNQPGVFPLRIQAQGRGAIGPLVAWNSLPDIENEYYITSNTFVGNYGIHPISKNLQIINTYSSPESLKINYSQQFSKNVSVVLYNMLGLPVFENRYESKFGLNEINISTKSVQPGIYVCVLNNGYQTITKRVQVD